MDEDATLLRELADILARVRAAVIDIRGRREPKDALKVNKFKAVLADVSLALGKEKSQRRLRIAANHLDSGKKEDGNGCVADDS